MIRLAVVVTDPMTADLLLRGQLASFRKRGFEVTVIASPGPALDEVGRREGVAVVPVEMSREIDPRRDAKSLLQLRRVFWRIRPDIVNGSTPKAGLLAMTAARMAGVPVCIYTLRGLRAETTAGLKRQILEAAERVTALCADEVVCVSHSLRAAYLRRRMCAKRKAQVLANGSSNGIHRRHFERSTGTSCQQAKGALGLEPESPVIGFVGRLTRDKGVNDLERAFEIVQRQHPDAQLLIVGGAEAGDAVNGDCIARLRKNPKVTLSGHVEDPAIYYEAMDVFVFPSQREGFPNAPLEAAARAVPTVGYQVTGVVDAVVDGTTGTLVTRDDVSALADSIVEYLGDPGVRARHGAAAAKRARDMFRPEQVWDALEDRYRAWTAVKQGRQRGLPAAVKRGVDICIAATLLGVTSPAMALTAAALRVGQGTPVLFRQPRPGRAGQVFDLIKFRTMSLETDTHGELLPDAERMTAVGSWVRRWSLDELPQFWNVLKGDMSLVGPRPLLVKYLGRYSERQRARHNVYPGITGWAQVHGRNAVPWDERLELDVAYVERWALWVDLQVLVRTLTVWAGRDGISEAGAATMQEFTGTSDERQAAVITQ